MLQMLEPFLKRIVNDSTFWGFQSLEAEQDLSLEELRVVNSVSKQIHVCKKTKLRLCLPLPAL